MASEPQRTDDIHAEHARANDSRLEPVTAVTINSPKDYVISRCQNYITHGREMELLCDVRLTSNDADMLHFADEENSLKGALRFADAAGGRGTILSCVMHVDRSFGSIGKIAATLAGIDPAMLARRDIRKLKQLCETGEIATSTDNRSERQHESGVE
jgi:hypothetical protein